MSAPARPKSAPSRLRRPATGRGAGARGHERAQPRHRGADLFGSRAGERIRAHARAIHGRGIPFSGQIWLRHGGSRRGRPGRAQRPPLFRALSAPDRVQPSRRRYCAAARTACRRSARCSPPTWRRRSTPPGTRRPGRPAASRWSAPGVVGPLVARLCARMPGAEVTLVDIDPSRAEIAAKLGLAFAAPDAAPRDCDLVVHTSASEAGLATSLDLAGNEATVLELSWYGANDVRGAARRRVPFAPAEARLEPGRAGRTVAARAIHAPRPA